MILNSIDKLRRKRAEFARNVEYTKEAAFGEMDDELFDLAESHYLTDDMDAMDFNEFVKFDDALTEEDEDADVEINRILEATEDLSFDEMIGVDDIEGSEGVNDYE